MAFCSKLSLALIVSSQVYFCQRTKQVTIWWCKVWTVMWMQQHCLSRICDSLCGVHTCVWLGTVTQEQHFIYFSCGMNSMKVGIQISQSFSIMTGVHFCHPGQKFATSSFSSQKTATTTFPAEGTLLNCFFLGMPYSFHRLPLGFGFKW